MEGPRAGRSRLAQHLRRRDVTRMPASPIYLSTHLARPGWLARPINLAPPRPPGSPPSSAPHVGDDDRGAAEAPRGPGLIPIDISRGLGEEGSAGTACRLGKRNAKRNRSPGRRAQGMNGDQARPSSSSMPPGAPSGPTGPRPPARLQAFAEGRHRQAPPRRGRALKLVSRSARSGRGGAGRRGERGASPMTTGHYPAGVA